MQKIVYEKIHSAEFVGSIISHHKDLVYALTIERLPSHSSGIGSSADNLHELCPDSVNWMEGKRFEAGTMKETMENWLENVRVK